MVEKTKAEAWRYFSSGYYMPQFDETDADDEGEWLREQFDILWNDLEDDDDTNPYRIDD